MYGKHRFFLDLLLLYSYYFRLIGRYLLPMIISVFIFLRHDHFDAVSVSYIPGVCHSTGPQFTRKGTYVLCYVTASRLHLPRRHTAPSWLHRHRAMCNDR